MVCQSISFVHLGRMPQHSGPTSQTRSVCLRLCCWWFRALFLVVQMHQKNHTHKFSHRFHLIYRYLIPTYTTLTSRLSNILQLEWWCLGSEIWLDFRCCRDDTLMNPSKCIPSLGTSPPSASRSLAGREPLRISEVMLWDSKIHILHAARKRPVAFLVHLCHFIKNVLFGQRFPRWLRFSNRSETVLIGKMFWKPFNKKLHPWTATEKSVSLRCVKHVKHIYSLEGRRHSTSTYKSTFIFEPRARDTLQYLRPGSVCVFGMAICLAIKIRWYVFIACSLQSSTTPDSRFTVT